LTEKPIPRGEWLAMLACCAVASMATLAWSWQHGDLLNYGDAVAHLHIARRVFDARLPRISELGSVWLPLPHLLMMPFVQVYSWWANGIAGAIPSVLAYMAGCAGLYRLSRRWMGRAPAAMTLVFFASNPNLLYLQTTGMTEPLFVCEMIWLADLLVEWRANLKPAPERARKLLWWVAAVLVAAVYTRYDGWIMALLAWTGIGLVLARSGKLRSRTFWLASAVVVAAPLVWFAYNAANWGDWLEFMRGPFSAKAIELRTATPGLGPPHPGWHNPWVSLLFFTKAAEMDAVVASCGNIMLTLSLLGTAWAWLAHRRAFGWSLLLWLPLPFYAYSVAFGSVPIFLPPWWPHSWYNTRYGMELLPALALGMGFAAQFALAAVREFKPSWVKYAVAALFAILALNVGEMVREHPLTYVEGIKNIEARRPLEQQIPPALKALLAERPGSTILMQTSVYPNLVAFTGIPLRQTINESDLWIWFEALKAPADHAAIVLAFDGDAVDQAVKAHPAGLRAIRQFTAPGQPVGTLYVTAAFPSASQRKVL
jgi:hypothetical protein